MSSPILTRRFEVGDVCEVRQWDDMAAEFGTTYQGNINCRCTFMEAMKYMCGETFTVKDKISMISGGYRYISEENIERGWIISSDMLELLSSNKEIDFDTDISNLLGY